eukprot:CAMPEP_0170558122 /NCGR_PEP_ID=MMETSP0211-20121228/32829_1 /TAXON_ID=311385 /ORGANISM="Pseudokeronopsis sp., Strain OXSARD2" /LENGTH=173 /DNA_ID=CAMNT_0010869739 /DNA_START=221 /DNA_END=742 /DNA_ORIENTATION=+
MYSNKEVPSKEAMIEAVETSMKALIEASVEHKVKRIVVTSSLASVIGDLFKKETGDTQYSELDFSPECGDAYTIGKVRQEAYIRTFLAEQEKSWKEGDHKLEIVTLNICLTVGPSLINSVQSSTEVFFKLMNGSTPGTVQLEFPVVDVRTVGEAHVNALVTPRISGERFIIGE